MIGLNPMLATVLLLGLSLAPAFGVPPIRCVHQTTSIKDGEATTHLIMTTARPGEARTARNTADVVFSGTIRPRPYSEPYNSVLEIVANKNYTIGVVHLDDGSKKPAANCPIYLFLSTERQGLVVLPDFGVRLKRFVAFHPVKHNDGTRWALSLWTPRQLYVMGITERTLEVRVGAAEVTEGTLYLDVAEDGQLSRLSYAEEGE